MAMAAGMGTMAMAVQERTKAVAARVGTDAMVVEGGVGGDEGDGGGSCLFGSARRRRLRFCWKYGGPGGMSGDRTWVVGTESMTAVGGQPSHLVGASCS